MACFTSVIDFPQIKTRNYDKQQNVNNYPSTQVAGKKNEKKHTADNQSKELLVNSLSGLISGTGAALITFPSEAMKKKKQSNQPSIEFRAFQLTTYGRSLKVLYTGCIAFGASVGPTTLVQTSAHAIFDRVKQSTGIHINPTFQAIMSGASGSVCSSFVENTILTQQLLQKQNLPHGPMAAIRFNCSKNIFSMWCGFSLLAVRESIFGALALGTADQFASAVSNYYQNPTLYFPSKLAIGVFGALLSHPFDTLATLKQKENFLNSNKPFHIVVKDFYKENSLRGFYKGGFYRVFLFTGCMLIISATLDPLKRNLNRVLAH